MNKTVNVIGLGYIGLPTALMLSANGINVVGTDCDIERVDELKREILPFNEIGMVELYKRAVKNGMRFSSDYELADTYIVTVPTPYDKTSKKINAECVIEAVSSVLNVCAEGADIVIESTISPGTTDKYIRPLIKDKPVNLFHAPERIIPGNMISELRNNARTIGADNFDEAEEIKNLYASFCDNEIIITDIRTAEMTKVVENTFRDVNIALVNELAKICSSCKMDVWEIIRIANKHPRVNLLLPGPGVGGHCISVDPWFLVGDFPTQTNLIRCARDVNDSMPEFVLFRLREIMNNNGMYDYSRVGLYGLTYKENIDDTRESPTLQLLEKWQKQLIPLPKVYDPFIKHNLVNNQLFELDAFLGAIDIVVIMVGHGELSANTEKFKDKLVFDTRHTGLFDNSYSL